MVRGLGLVDGGVDEETLAVVMLTSNEKRELRVVLGVVNDTRELLEARTVDDRTDEVLGSGRHTNLESLNFRDHLLLELGPNGLGHVEPAGSAALLSLVFESATDGLDGGILDVGTAVHQVEVLAASLTDDTGVALVATLSGALADSAVQLAEDTSAAGVVQGSELLMGQHSLSDLFRRTGHELNNVLGQTSLDEDLVQQPVGGNGRVRRLPDNNVAKKRRSPWKVASDGGEVERRDSVDETLERSVLNPVPDTGCVVGGLLRHHLFGVRHVEAEEIAKLGGSVDLGLPCILALADHGSSHDVVAVLGGDEVGGLEEDCSTVGEGEGGPGLLGSESRLDSIVDVLGGR